MSTIWSSRARKRSFCPLSRRSFGRIANHSRRLSSDRESRLGARLNLQVAARSTDQAGKIEYFKIPANAQIQDTSEFFTDDYATPALGRPNETRTSLADFRTDLR